MNSNIDAEYESMRLKVLELIQTGIDAYDSGDSDTAKTYLLALSTTTPPAMVRFMLEAMMLGVKNAVPS